MMQYVKFHCKTWYGGGCALQYFGVVQAPPPLPANLTPWWNFAEQHTVTAELGTSYE